MSGEHFEWLQDRVETIVRACRSERANGLVVYFPAAGGEMYGAFYLRDFTYMVECVPEFIPVADVRQALVAFLRGIREDGVCPEKLGLEGQPFHNCHGPLPAADSAPFLVKLVNAYHEMAGEPALLDEHFDRLRKGLDVVPTDPASGLVWIDPARPHTAYGFADTIAKTGEVLFCSLLMVEAWGMMSKFAADLGRDADARDCAERGERVRSSLSRLWSDENGLFFAASRDCRQPDLWGSLYASHTGAATPAQTQRISDWFLRNAERAVYRGHVRHLPEPDYWERLIVPEFAPPGTFQNGPYWSTPSGWLAGVLESASPGKGEQVLCDLVDEFRENGIWECIGRDGYQRLTGNASSVVLPYAAFKKWIPRS